MRKNVIFSTTINQNIGDKLILRGMMNVLPSIMDHNLIYYDRGEFTDKTTCETRNGFNMDKILSLAEFFINAGTPGFYQQNYPFYDKCVESNIPFALIGIGCHFVDDGMDKTFNHEKEHFRRQLNHESCILVTTRDRIIYDSILTIMEDPNKVYDSICPAIFSCNDPFNYSEKVIILNTCEMDKVEYITKVLREVLKNIPIILVVHEIGQLSEHLKKYAIY